MLASRKFSYHSLHILNFSDRFKLMAHFRDAYIHIIGPLTTLCLLLCQWLSWSSGIFYIVLLDTMICLWRWMNEMFAYYFLVYLRYKCLEQLWIFSFQFDLAIYIYYGSVIMSGLLLATDMWYFGCKLISRWMLVQLWQLNRSRDSVLECTAEISSIPQFQDKGFCSTLMEIQHS